jgi:hypothetical protein
MTQDKAAASGPRYIIAQLTGGAALGFAASCIFGPGVLGWWYEPPIKDAFSCASSVRDALAKFVTMELISAGSGAVLMLLVVFFVRRALARDDAAPVQPQSGS